MKKIINDDKNKENPSEEEDQKNQIQSEKPQNDSPVD